MTRVAHEIPLSPKAQSFVITLAGTQYAMVIRWNKYLTCWVLDVGTPDGVDLVTGIPVVTGRDLFEPYPDLNFGGALIAQTDHDPDAVPTLDDLGVRGRLYFVTG